MRHVAPAILVCLLQACGGDPRPNVVVVLLDTLRPDHLELYGYERTTAPWIASVGARGTVFTNAFSSSAWTPPATASTLTGLYPPRHGVVHGLETNERLELLIAEKGSAPVSLVSLPAAHPTLAERFRAAGYATYGIATNVHIDSPLGFDRGFERFHHIRDADAARVRELVRGFAVGNDEPWFLYLHLNDVHLPNEARSPWYESFADVAVQPSDDLASDAAARAQFADHVRRYDSEISFADHELAALARELAIDEHTLVCLVSDHGEAFGEKGFVGHGATLHGAVNRVLFALAGPGVPALEIDSNVSLVDVYPTLLELAGLDSEPDTEPMVDGVSLVPLLTEDTRTAARTALANRTVFAHRRARATPITFLWSAVRGRWKLIHVDQTGVDELYDLESDPGELVDLAAREPERLSEMKSLLAEFQRTSAALAAGQQVEVSLDQELSEHLRDVGYAGE